MDSQERKRTWEQKISEYRSSGVSTTAWCEQNNIKISALRYWISRLNKEKRETTNIQWISMDDALAMNASDTTSIVIKIGKASVHVTPSFSENTLLRVLKVLHTYA